MLILLSVYKFPASFLYLREAVLLLCTIYCRSRKDAPLTRLNWSGHFFANLMRILMIICLHLYWNNLFFFSCNLRRGKNSFHPAPMSTRTGLSWFFESCNHFSFSMQAINHALSIASFLKIRPTSFLKIALSLSNINGTVGVSVWKHVKYGSNMPPTNKKKCNSAGTKGSE